VPAALFTSFSRHIEASPVLHSQELHSDEYEVNLLPTANSSAFFIFPSIVADGLIYPFGAGVIIRSGHIPVSFSFFFGLVRIVVLLQIVRNASS